MAYGSRVQRLLPPAGQLPGHLQVQDEDGWVAYTTRSVTVSEADTRPSFGGATVQDQTYTVDTAIPPLTLPAATGGNGVLRYTLSPLPAGLGFDAVRRRLSGTPTTAEISSMTYRVQDADADSASLGFTITVLPAGPPECLLDPTAPSRPSPSDGAAGVSRTPVLSWSGGDSQCGNEITYDVYLSPSRTRRVRVASDIIGRSHSVPVPLPASTTYYWEVHAKDSNGRTVTSSWSFETEASTDTDTDSRTGSFTTAQDYLNNAKVRSALADSGFTINYGSSPPTVAGTLRQGSMTGASITPTYSAEYQLSGRVVDAGGGAFQALNGIPVRSLLCLFDQTASGSISVRERSLGIEVTADGHITGSGDYFTTYIQSEQDLSAQLSQLNPTLAQQLGVCEIEVSALASGRRTAADNLADLGTLTAVTAFYCPGLYDLAVNAGADPSTVRQTIESVANSWYLASSSATNRGTCQQ